MFRKFNHPFSVEQPPCMDSFEKSVKRTNLAIFIIATIAVCVVLTGLVGLSYLETKLIHHIQQCKPSANGAPS